MPDSKAESVTWKGKWRTPFSAMFSEFCWLFSRLQCLVSSAGCFHNCNVWWVLLVVFTTQFYNKCRELYRNSRRLFGKRDQDDDERSSSIAWQCATWQCCHNYLLTSWSCKIPPHPPHSPDLHHQTSIYSQGWKSTSEVSTSTPIKMFITKSRQSYMPRAFLFSWRTRLVDISKC
jgi:hypothetical protein